MRAVSVCLITWLFIWQCRRHKWWEQDNRRNCKNSCEQEIRLIHHSQWITQVSVYNTSDYSKFITTTQWLIIVIVYKSRRRFYIKLYPGLDIGMPGSSKWGNLITQILERFSRAGPRGRGREWATLGEHPLTWLLSNNRLEKVPFVSVLHTSSNRLLLSNQDKGCTPSVAHSLPLPLGPALLNLWTITGISRQIYLKSLV